MLPLRRALINGIRSNKPKLRRLSFQLVYISLKSRSTYIACAMIFSSSEEVSVMGFPFMLLER